MAVLLLTLLVAYVAVVSAPRASKSGISAALSVQLLNGFDATALQLVGARMYMSKGGKS